MRQKRSLETEEQRDHRLERQAQGRVEDAIAEDKALDAMIRRSIELHGP
jgi:hypothetical protein